MSAKWYDITACKVVLLRAERYRTGWWLNPIMLGITTGCKVTEHTPVNTDFVIACNNTGSCCSWKSQPVHTCFQSTMNWEAIDTPVSGESFQKMSSVRASTDRVQDCTVRSHQMLKVQVHYHNRQVDTAFAQFNTLIGISQPPGNLLFMNQRKTIIYEPPLPGKMLLPWPLQFSWWLQKVAGIVCG